MPKTYVVHDTVSKTYTPCQNKFDAMSLVSRLEALDKYDGFYKPHRYVIIVNKSFFNERSFRYEK